MRWVLAALSCVFMLPLGEPKDAPLLEDPEGDVRGEAGEYPMQVAPGVDLLSLHASADDGNLSFELRVPALENVYFRDSVAYRIEFDLTPARYRVTMLRFISPLGVEASYYPELYRTNNEGSFKLVETFEVIPDEGDGTLEFRLPFGHFRELDNATGVKALENLFVYTYQDYEEPTDSGQGRFFADRMPDQGSGRFEMEFGPGPVPSAEDGTNSTNRTDAPGDDHVGHEASDGQWAESPGGKDAPGLGPVPALLTLLLLGRRRRP